MPGILPSIGTVRGFAIGGSVMLAIGFLGGEIHGRKAVEQKWKARVADVQGEVLRLKAAASSSMARRSAVIEKDRATMRTDDKATQEAFRALRERSRKDAQTIRRLIQEARNAPDKFNCANMPMPGGLQRRATGSGSGDIPG